MKNDFKEKKSSPRRKKNHYERFLFLKQKMRKYANVLDTENVTFNKRL